MLAPFHNGQEAKQPSTIVAWRHRVETCIDIASFGALVVPIVALGFAASMVGAAGKAVVSLSDEFLPHGSESAGYSSEGAATHS